MSAEMMPLLTKALGETIYMVIVSMAISSAIGVPLGVLLHVTSKGEILDAPMVNRTVGAAVNAVRSIPFIILMVAIIPLTRLIVGSAIGTTAAMVPLVIASVPFIGRQVETSLREVPHGLIEAALAMGATPMQIITRVLLPESMPGIVSQLTTVIIALVGESAMAGAIGGGGLGDRALEPGRLVAQQAVVDGALHGGRNLRSRPEVHLRDPCADGGGAVRARHARPLEGAGAVELGVGESADCQGCSSDRRRRARQAYCRPLPGAAPDDWWAFATAALE